MSHALLDIAAHVVELATKAGATSADAVVLQSTELSTGIRNGAPETIERAESRGVGLRVFIGQSTSILSSSDVSPAALQKLADHAIAIAKAAPPDPYAGLADVSQLATNIPSLDMADAYEPSMETLQQLACECEAAGLAVKGISNTEGADAGFSRQHVALVTSHGFARGYESTQSAISIALIAGEDDAMERDYDYSAKAFFSDLPAASTVGVKAAERTLARLNPRKVNSQQAAIFFEPREAKSLLSAFAGAISGTTVARGTSFLKNDMGKKIFADGITIIDDPLIPRGNGSHPFDAEGIAAKKTEFVTNGTLNSWMLDCRSARQLGLQTTGHAIRGLSSAPHPASTNLYIAPGKESPEALMKAIGTGFYVTETIGHGTNLITGDYSVGATGFWIENGQIAYPVSEVTIAGNLREMYATLVAANDLVFRSSTNTPTLMVPRMTIAGE